MCEREGIMDTSRDLADKIALIFEEKSLDYEVRERREKRERAAEVIEEHVKAACAMAVEAERKRAQSERSELINAQGEPCEGCGKRSSIFTAGCDHCDYEDK